MRTYNHERYKIGDKVELSIHHKWNSDVIEAIDKLSNREVTITELHGEMSGIKNEEPHFSGIRFYTEELSWHFPIEIIKDFAISESINNRFEILDL